MNNNRRPAVAQFVVDSSAAESMARSLNLPSVRDLLPRLVPSAESLARPPISNFHVGAVGLGSDGRVFVGVNIEFPGLPLHHSIHAEQFLLTNLVANGCPNLLAFAVSAAPCGHCRQFLQELRHSASVEIHVIDDDKCVQTREFVQIPETIDPDFKPLSKFLPSPFGPHDLLDRENPLLLENHDNGLDLFPQIDSYVHQNSTKLSNGNDENHGRLSNGNVEKIVQNEALLKKVALEAANSAHAPYSGCPSGVALMDCEGNVYKGSYMESAAYNPSLGPVQAALVSYVAKGGGGYERIVAAVLVEKEVAIVKQEDTARLLLKTISPKCQFKAFYCQSAGN